MIVLDADGVGASRPNRVLFADLSVTVDAGDRIGVVGLNGSGKSTLLRILAGERQPDTGVVRRGRGARVGMLAQIPQLPDGSVRDAVGHAWRGEAVLDRLGMAAVLDESTGALSGGQQKRVALAALLVGEWEALILDEPTNHLDLDAIAFLEEWLAAFNGGLVLVTHDRHVLDRVTTKVLELDRGSAYLHQPTGWHSGSGYAAYLAERAERAERETTAEQVRANLARRELAWLRRGAPARSTKPKARVAAASAIVAGRPAPAVRSGPLGLELGSQRLGSQGVELHGVGFTWPDGRRVLEPIDLGLEPGDRLGVVGGNGVGKTTLLDLIAERLQPTEGHITRGRTVRIGYYDQLGRDLRLDARVRDVVAGDKGEPSVTDLALMRRFWFDGDAQYAPLAMLSGGERRRLQLLLTLIEQPNVLLLDEPTNDLDLDTLRALEELLDDWKGIVVAVSHDRSFLDRTVTDVLAIDSGGAARQVRGGVAGWLAERATPPQPAQTTAPPGPPRAVERAVGRRSPSTLRREMAAAERRVADETRRRDELLAELAAAAADYAAVTTVSEQLAKVQAALEVAEESWLVLAAEADELGLDV